MALKHRTCVAALAAQRDIANQNQINPDKVSSPDGKPFRDRRNNFQQNSKGLADDLTYQSTAAAMIRKLRQLTPPDIDLQLGEQDPRVDKNIEV